MSTDGSQGGLTPRTTPRPQTQKKLRSSCDACSASKIKCDQERPSCLRCRNIEVKCNYSASRRMGKPPAPRDANGMKSTKSRTALARKEIEASLLSLQKLGPDSLHPQSSLAPLDLETYFMDSDDLIPTQWHVASFYSPGSSTNGSSDVAIAPTSLFDHDLKFLEEAKPNLLAPRASTDDMFVFDDICIDLGPSKSNGTFTSLDGTTGQTLKASHQSLFQVHDCTTLASSMIQLLHMDSSTCGASATPQGNLFQPISSIDQFLSTTNQQLKTSVLYLRVLAHSVHSTL